MSCLYYKELEVILYILRGSTYCRICGAPHIRHSKAIHLLRSGVPLIYIRDFLGHVSVTITEIYAKVDVEENRKALESAYEIPSQNLIPDWEADKGLMAWLEDLCR